MPDTDRSQVAHLWTPIADLTAEDVEAGNAELGPLAEVWRDEQQALAEDAVGEFTRRLRTEWAIETGIIERLYTLDRGVTQVLIERGIQAEFIPAEATNRSPVLLERILRDQEAGIEFVFELVAGRRPLGVSFVKELHALMTRHLETTTAVDQFGRVFEVALEKGVFKTRPNNPTRPDGSIHQYCPPEQVDVEMERLLAMHAEHENAKVPPEVEAAWLHHRFTQIHPFQDGNGRVARALASLVFIRARWFPLVVDRDDRTAYLDALEVADSNGLEPLVTFFAALQKRAFVAALGIVRQVSMDSKRIDQQLDAISEMFARRDAEARAELERAKEIAHSMYLRGVERLEKLEVQLEKSMSISGFDSTRRVFVDSADNDNTERRTWHRWQIQQAARKLGYHAGFGEFACWARLGIDTESGRSEILLAFHQIGAEYRGVIGASLSLNRREPSDQSTQISDVHAVTDEVFQLNYHDSAEAVAHRFDSWLEHGLVRALDQWRRSE